VPTHSDTPIVWINTNNPADHTNRGELEISAATLAVIDIIDYRNYRADLVAASGNLQGTRLELISGLTKDLAIF